MATPSSATPQTAAPTSSSPSEHSPRSTWVASGSGSCCSQGWQENGHPARSVAPTSCSPSRLHRGTRPGSERLTGQDSLVVMSRSLVWISGASSGIGRALAATVPWEGARLFGVSRRPPAVGEHLEADLAEPGSWELVGRSFEHELTGWSGERVVFVHAAGVLEPVGFVGEVATDSYVRNVILNSAAGQVLGHMFLAAARDVDARRHVVMLTSGAARSIYPGWAPYGAGKAALDQWVRDAGAEQELRGGAQVLAVAPGTVDTDMQDRLRETAERDFPQRQKFVDLYQDRELADPERVAADIWALLDRKLENGAVIDLRELNAARER